MNGRAVSMQVASPFRVGSATTAGSGDGKYI